MTIETQTYTVLARKYRPQDFTTLIGQTALVQTLSNAIKENKLHHAYMLTGVRGVGKTTTARILAKVMNCQNLQENINPCNTCDDCQSIISGRHIDVFEIDAASNTGVDNVREIIEGSQYKPASATYRVYIVDEVHMLSTAAFNALLKILEEPPAHMKFIFATTDIHKVPVTVLSRCQRFDLRRITPDVMSDHFKTILSAENINCEDEALNLIVRAADGSVRDGLSLLDQAIALSAGNVQGDVVADMLGQANRGAVIDLYKSLVAGDIPTTLAKAAELYSSGAEPENIVKGLSDIVHHASKVKALKTDVDSLAFSKVLSDEIAQITENVTMASLSRSWQMLQNGLGEVRQAIDMFAAVEMVLIRLAYASHLPPLEEVAKSIPNNDTPDVVPSATEDKKKESLTPLTPQPVQQTQQTSLTPNSSSILPTEFSGFVQWLSDEKEAVLVHHLQEDVELVCYSPTELEIFLRPLAPKNIGVLIMNVMKSHNIDFQVKLSEINGHPPLGEQKRMALATKKENALANPIIQSVMEKFPGAEIIKIEETI